MTQNEALLQMLVNGSEQRLKDFLEAANSFTETHLECYFTKFYAATPPHTCEEIASCGKAQETDVKDLIQGSAINSVLTDGNGLTQISDNNSTEGLSLQNSSDSPGYSTASTSHSSNNMEIPTGTSYVSSTEGQNFAQNAASNIFVISCPDIPILANGNFQASQIRDSSRNYGVIMLEHTNQSIGVTTRPVQCSDDAGSQVRFSGETKEPVLCSNATKTLIECSGK